MHTHTLAHKDADASSLPHALPHLHGRKIIDVVEINVFPVNERLESERARERASERESMSCLLINA